MIILGIDPGTALTGYAILDVHKPNSYDLIDYSVVKTPAGMLMHKRLHIIHNNLIEISNEHKPDLMVIERLFFNTNVKTAMSVGQARGVPLLVASMFNMHVFEYTALQAKSLLTGYGRASKKEMQEAVKQHLDLKEVVKPDDANDAIAMALTFINKDYSKFKKEQEQG